MTSFIDCWVAIAMLVWATIQDIRDYTIPMASIGYGILGGFISGIALHGVHGLIESCVGGSVGLALGLLMNRVVRLGMGDVLLYAALGVILGPMCMLSIFVLSNAVALIRITIPVLRRHRHVLPRQLRRWMSPVLKRNKVTRIAFAPYILFGTLVLTLAITIR